MKLWTKIRQWWCNHDPRITTFSIYDDGVTSQTYCDDCGKAVPPHDPTEVDRRGHELLREHSTAVH